MFLDQDKTEFFDRRHFYGTEDLIYMYSLSPGFWQSFVTIGVHKDHIPALARFCKKQLTGFFSAYCFS